MTLFSNKFVTFDIDNDGMTITFHEDQSFIHVGLVEGSIAINMNDKLQAYISGRDVPILQVGERRVALDKVVKALEALGQ